MRHSTSWYLLGGLTLVAGIVALFEPVAGIVSLTILAAILPFMVGLGRYLSRHFSKHARA